MLNKTGHGARSIKFLHKIEVYFHIDVSRYVYFQSYLQVDGMKEGDFNNSTPPAGGDNPV